MLITSINTERPLVGEFYFDDYVEISVRIDEFVDDPARIIMRNNDTAREDGGILDLVADAANGFPVRFVYIDMPTAPRTIRMDERLRPPLILGTPCFDVKREAPQWSDRRLETPEDFQELFHTPTYIIGDIPQLVWDGEFLYIVSSFEVFDERRSETVRIGGETTFVVACGQTYSGVGVRPNDNIINRFKLNEL